MKLHNNPKSKQAHRKQCVRTIQSHLAIVVLVVRIFGHVCLFPASDGFIYLNIITHHGAKLELQEGSVLSKKGIPNHILFSSTRIEYSKQCHHVKQER